MTNKFEAILAINPNATFQTEVINGEEIVTWNDNMTPISDIEINAKIIELKNKWLSKQYQRDRAKAYPSIQEQLDLQYWDKVNGTDTWEQAINAVKVQYPKA
jgi:hypothetical protein